MHWDTKVGESEEEALVAEATALEGQQREAVGEEATA